MNKKVIIFSAPSGAGKTTIVKHFLQLYPNWSFSISATTRPSRNNEENGTDYYFLNEEEFKYKIDNQEFVEWEEVYSGRYYGTLKSELERIWAQNKIVIFDVDVKGGINLKKIFGSQALSIFISPPSIEVLKDRLINRKTETEETLKIRVKKAEEEMTFASQFDKIIINDLLEHAINEIIKQIESHK